jgi:ubiquinone/menaquinone biosynthesis C-methylase UbiE/uncharacterized protein YbaR (Trm112 family)
MTDQNTLDGLQCPACAGTLARDDAAAGRGTSRDVASAEIACEACGRTYPVDDGIPRLIHPPRLLPSDSEFQGKYDRGADEYDTGLDWLFASFGQDQARFRRELVGRLDLRPGMRVIETGCGTGQDSAEIAARIAPGGELYVQDLSIGMLQLAQRRLRDVRVPVRFVLSNASYLPLPTSQFDAAFHFGGINTFGEVRRAIDEMTRVVRPGGAVVFGDEGIAPWLRRRLIGRILVKANPLYRHRPPIDRLPDVAQDVRLSWLLGNAFYVIEYRVGESPPFVDLDLPIPGPRNGTLRSRYYVE